MEETKFNGELQYSDSVLIKNVSKVKQNTGQCVNALLCFMRQYLCLYIS